jgi:glycosyltransferase involved in cell wall biosynthesis
MPSKEEGFGNAAVEAMAVGLIPILSDVRALSDFRHYSNSIFWTKPKEKELAEKMHELLTLNDSQISQYRKELNKSMKENFGINAGGLSYGQLYIKLCENVKSN